MFIFRRSGLREFVVETGQPFHVVASHRVYMPCIVQPDVLHSTGRSIRETQGLADQLSQGLLEHAQDFRRPYLHNRHKPQENIILAPVDCAAAGSASIIRRIHTPLAAKIHVTGTEPGASTTAFIAIGVLGKCFGGELTDKAWLPKLKQIIPSYGISLIEDAELLRRVRADAAKVLKVENIDAPAARRRQREENRFRRPCRSRHPLDRWHRAGRAQLPGGGLLVSRRVLRGPTIPRRIR